MAIETILTTAVCTAPIVLGEDRLLGVRVTLPDDDVCYVLAWEDVARLYLPPPEDGEDEWARDQRHLGECRRYVTAAGVVFEGVPVGVVTDYCDAGLCAYLGGEAELDRRDLRRLQRYIIWLLHRSTGVQRLI